ncbi:MAG TPA: AAA family ATPase [Micropruina sp.]|nr:AAA family ATPase [Micropruina sp.]
MDEGLSEVRAARIRPIQQPVAVLVDLGRIRSRYGSETEKALAELFDTAEREGWTLAFDEADALFTRRSEVADAHDRFADLEVNLLLQRIEELSKSMVTRLPDVQQNPGLAAYAVRRFPPL